MASTVHKIAVSGEELRLIEGALLFQADALKAEYNERARTMTNDERTAHSSKAKALRNLRKELRA